MSRRPVPAAVEKAHCPRCAGYEDRVMRRRPGEALPAAVRPCPDYAMSDRFRDWAVAQMQKEVMGEVTKSGLDRMAILKGKAPEAGAGPEAGA